MYIFVLCVVVYIKRKKKFKRRWCEGKKKPQNQLAFIALFDTHTHPSHEGNNSVMGKKKGFFFFFDIWY